MYTEHLMAMGGMHAVWWIFWLVVVLALVGAMVAALGRCRSRAAGDDASPLAILQQRLARGEMSPEAYEQTRALLERDASRR